MSAWLRTSVNLPINGTCFNLKRKDGLASKGQRQVWTRPIQVPGEKVLGQKMWPVHPHTKGVSDWLTAAGWSWTLSSTLVPTQAHLVLTGPFSEH